MKLESKEPVTERGHILHTSLTCPCDKENDSPCVVCDWGLAVCRICGAAECELNERDCTRKFDIRGEECIDPDSRCFE